MLIRDHIVVEFAHHREQTLAVGIVVKASRQIFGQVRALAHPTRHHDDARAIAHERQQAIVDGERGEQIGIERGPHDIRVKAAHRHTGIVHQNIDTAVLFLQMIRERFNALAVAYIHLEHLSAHAVLGQTRTGGPSAVQAPTCEHHVHTTLTELPANFQSNTSISARDDGYALMRCHERSLHQRTAPPICAPEARPPYNRDVSEPMSESVSSVTTDRPNLLLHGSLFVVTCATTIWAGMLSFGTWSAGVSFGATLMFILTCHEMGHYVVARRHGIAVSPPYFIPLPPQISLGTLGAVIRMKQTIDDRNQLLDVGASGPIAGLIVAIPLLCIGLWQSPLEPQTPGAYIEGNSLLYLGLKYAVFGRYLPGDGVDVVLHPMAFAAWVGLLITMINLIPIGQLDGGHIACSVLGARHEQSSRRLHASLLVIASVAMMGLVIEAQQAGLTTQRTLVHGITGAMPWFVWAAVLYGLRRASGNQYHPPVEATPLTPGRRLLAWFMLAVFISIMTPVPFRSSL